MLALVVPLHVKPGRAQEFLDLLTPVLDAMRGVIIPSPSGEGGARRAASGG
jgi:hypothetical protein